MRASLSVGLIVWWVIESGFPLKKKCSEICLSDASIHSAQRSFTKKYTDSYFFDFHSIGFVRSEIGSLRALSVKC
jgi:hypothetical protein